MPYTAQNNEAGFPVFSSQAPQSGNPGFLSSAATTMQSRVTLMRDCYGGTETMRAAGATYLPQYEKESTTRYNARLASTFALNKLREAVDAASAKPFRTLLKIQNGDPDLDQWVQDVDLQGNHLHVFAHQLFNNAMLDGMCHILVDHPDTFNFKSYAVQKAANVRPFMKLFRTDSVIAAYDEYVGGDIKTLHVRIQTQRSNRDNFREFLYDQLRIIEVEPGSDQGIVQLWERRGSAASTEGGGGWIFVGETPLQMDEVPFKTLYAGDKEGDYLVKPIFQDLAYKQIEHWISSSDQRSILSAARFPMLACSGVQIDPDDEAQFAIGPYKVLYAPEANGRWYYVEPKGTAIDSGQKDLDKLEMQMDMLALNPVTGTHRQYVPQNERDIQETRVHSVVHDMSIRAQDTIEAAINLMGKWINRDYSQVQCILNTEFANTSDRIAEVGQLVTMYEKRGISRETLLREVYKRNLLGDDFNMQNELAALAAIDAALGGSTPTTGQPTDPQDPSAVAGGGGNNGSGAAQPTGGKPPTGMKAGGAKPDPSWPAGQNRPKPQF
ncbi:DUF4055 domain-containing protein [Bradyrhizobium erythrophlei]|uniref:DUF4055 domain-containing protein n=1 Tax=Bradyrhizobium erythrophlei TaxID=1437360 RepID=A0A1M5PWS1_9BRAD|nr:DUF4055 domain-containing protein [Bradyrhizobium erythrophlei]SHH05981.1 protein of unknown function [Bradyrhizobium erythrophlei]